MNFVGKILTALIAVFAILFMAFALAVYATHKNWKKEAGELQAKWDEAKKQNQENEAKLAQLDKDFTAEKKALGDALAALKVERDKLQADSKQLAEENVKLAQDYREAVAAYQTAQGQMKNLQVERDDLRGRIAAAQKQQDDAFKAMLAMTDEMNQIGLELRDANQVKKTLEMDNQKYRLVLAKHGLEGNPDLYLNVAPPVEAHVTAVGEKGMVTVSVGSDHGLRKGHQLEIFRPNQQGVSLLARAEVVSTEADKAVCKLLPNFTRGPVQKGDNVTSIR
jgi:hypothetical protein